MTFAVFEMSVIACRNGLHVYLWSSIQLLSWPGVD